MSTGVDDTAAAARRAWARPFIARDRGAPAYGTPEWLALPDGPSKVAAVVRAAECWITEHEDTLRQLDAERVGRLLDAKQAEDLEFIARRAAHRRDFIPTLPGFRRDPATATAIEAEWQAWVDGDDAA